MRNNRLKKNDRVMVIAGKDKGKIGKVIRVLPADDKALVERVNLIKRHTRASGDAKKGGILEKEAAIHLSNLMIVCDKCAGPVRIGTKVLEDGAKVRICRKCSEVLDIK
ncbi:MAG: 50S ribosomal protein L24 [Deltaproteobacteria bacterium]|nr:50S ribosomal protein L24 [Deltaproteobacteria bacterium]